MPGTFRDELGNAVRNTICAALAFQENWYNFASRVSPYPGATFIANLAREYFGGAYRMLCNEEPPPEPAPPFTGGQCNSVYSIVVDIYACVPSGGCGLDPGYGIGSYQGPISSIVGDFLAGSGWGVTVGTATGPARFNISSAGPSAYTTWRVENAYLTRAGGLPDNCGDPPTPVPPGSPDYNVSTDTFTYTDNSGVDIDVDINLRFGSPTITPTGQLNIPIRVDIGELGISFGGNVNMNDGDVTYNFNNQNYSRNGTPTPDAFESPDDTPEVPPSVPEPSFPPSIEDDDDETQRIIRACIVTSSYSNGSLTQIGQGDNPDIFAPNLGCINFYCAIGSRVAWTEDIPVKNLRQIIQCPFDGGAIEVKGTPRPGVTWTITPVYYIQESEVTFSF